MAGAAVPARRHRALEGSRPDARQGHGGRAGRVRRRRPRARALPRLPGAADGAERLRLRRPAAAQPDAVHATIPTCWQTYQRHFRYILVDEYQDTNVAQYLWLRLLAQQHRNLCCVGDDDQSIYCWRGAEVGNILRFESDFPGARIVRLERNYRSTPHILAAASGLIAHNERPPRQDAVDRGASGGEKVQVRGVWDGEDEARFVGDEIEALQREGARARARSRSWCAPASRPASSRSGSSRWACPTASSAARASTSARRSATRIAYLRVVRQPDDDLAFERIVNMPRARHRRRDRLRSIHVLARAAACPAGEAAARLIETDELKPAARKRARRAVSRDLDALARAAERGHAACRAGRSVLDESGYTAMWQADKSPEAPGRLENLKELIAAHGGVREPGRASSSMSAW